MSAIRMSILVLLLCVVSAKPMGGQSTGVSRATAKEPAVKMTLTKFELAGSSLQLECEIVSASDHDVWVCDHLNWGRSHSIMAYEVFLESESNTLMIRRRLSVPDQMHIEMGVEGTYVRLSPGKKRMESFALVVPVDPRTALASMGPTGVTATATRLVVEIGFYDEDVPSKIRTILELAQKLKCAIPSSSELGDSINTYYQYFPGLVISQRFGGTDGFSRFWTEGSDQIRIPWMWPTFDEETSLKVTVDGLELPYEHIGYP